MADEMNKLNVQAGFTITDEESGLAELNKIINSINKSSETLGKSFKTIEDALSVLATSHKDGNASIVIQSKKTASQIREEEKRTTLKLNSELKQREESHKQSEQRTTNEQKSQLKLREKEYDRFSSVIKSELKQREDSHKHSEMRMTAETKSQIKLREKEYNSFFKDLEQSSKAVNKALSLDGLKDTNNYLNYFKRNIAQSLLTATGLSTVINEFSQVSSKVVEVEKNAINIRRILGTSSEETSKTLIESAFEAAKATATQVTDAQEIQAAWVRINDIYANNLELLGQMTTLTSKFMNVGEIESTEDAVTLLNATMLQFGLTTNDTIQTIANSEEVLNKWAYLADKTAMGTADEYGKGLARFGGQLKNLNGDVDDGIVLMSILSDKLAKTGEEAGTSLKTFTAYLTRTKTINLFDQIASDLGDVNYQLVDTNGKFKEFDELMNAVSKAYEYYKSVGNDVMAQSILDALGATRQRDTVVALMDAWSDATSGAQKYYDFLDSAAVNGYMDDQNVALIESFAAHWEQLKTSMVEAAYAIADAGLFDSLEGLMSGLQWMMETISDLNPVILKSIVTVGELTVGYKLLQKALSISKTYREYVSALKYGTQLQRESSIALKDYLEFAVKRKATEEGLTDNIIASKVQFESLNRQYAQGAISTEQYQKALLKLNDELDLGLSINKEGIILDREKKPLIDATTEGIKKETLATIAHKVATKEMTVADAAHLAIQQAKLKVTALLQNKVLLLTVAISAAAGAYKLFTWWAERNERALEESIDKYKEAAEAVDNQTNALDTATQRQKELNDLKNSAGGLSDAEQAELDALNAEIPLLEAKLQLLKDQEEYGQRQAARDFIKNANDTSSHRYTDDYGNTIGVNITDTEYIEMQTQKLQELAEEYGNLQAQIEKGDLSNSEMEKAVNRTEALKKQIDELKYETGPVVSAMIEILSLIGGVTDEEVAGIEETAGAGKSAVEDFVEASKEASIATGDSAATMTDGLNEMADAAEEVNATFAEMSINNIANDINSVTDSIDGLTDAQDKLAKGTALSNLELMKLAEKYPELLAQANLFADGSVESQKNAINAVLGMKQEEFNSSIDQKIAELDADNELINQQLELEAQKLNIIAELEGMLSGDIVANETDVENKLLELDELRLENVINETNGELQVNADAKEEILKISDESNRELVDGSNQVGVATEQALADGSYYGADAFAENTDSAGASANGLIRGPLNALATAVLNAFAGKQSGTSASNSKGGSQKSGRYNNATYNGSSGNVEANKVASNYLSNFKTATNDFISKLKAQYQANTNVINNLNKYKDIGVKSVSSSGGSGGSSSGSKSNSGSGSSGSSKSSSGDRDRYGNDTSSTAYKNAVNNIEDLLDDLVKALKNKYQELYDARVAYLEKERDAQIKAHNDRIAQLQAEIDKIKGNTTEDKEANLAQLQEKYALWSQDNSTLGKSKQKDLAEQIKELSDEIKIDKLEQEIDKEQASIEAIEDYFEALFDADSPLFDPELKVLTNKMSTANLTAEATALMVEGKTDDIIQLLTRYGNVDTDAFASLMGKTAGEQIAEKVESAMSSYSQMIAGALQGVSTPSYSGGSYGGGSSGGSSSGSSGGSNAKKCGSIGHTVPGTCPVCGAVRKYAFKARNTTTGAWYTGARSYSTAAAAVSAGQAFVKNNRKTVNGKLIYVYDIDSVQACASGGVVSKGSNLLDMIASSVGEDTMIAVKAGERVLSPAQTKAFDSLVYDFLPSIKASLNPNNTTNNKNITFNKELVSVKVDKVINNTPYDVQNGQDNLDRMLRKSLKKAGMNIGV